MILFETSMSVFELLWDLALALFIFRISFIYFALSFLSSLLITYFRITRLEPIHHLTQPQAELYSLPLWLLVNMLWSRWVIVHFEIPKVAGFRLGIGGVALVFMVFAEVGWWVLAWKEGMKGWIWETDGLAAGVGVVVLILFGLLPWLLMGFERRDEVEKRTYHGHEDKKIVNALPTIGKLEKEQVNGKKTK